MFVRPTRSLFRVSLGAPLLVLGLAACADENTPSLPADAGGSDAAAQGGASDSGTPLSSDGSASGEAGSVEVDAGDSAPSGDPDSGISPVDDGGAPVDGGTPTDGGSCTDGGNCINPNADPLAPFQLDCANLPSGAVCQGGPREVLLVTMESGTVVMFDPKDGHFLGYFKRPSADFNLSDVADHILTTQGPDQCIWSVSNDDRAGVQRWNTDGTFRDAPLEAHSIDISGDRPDEASHDVLSFAFTRDHVFVGSEFGRPKARIVRYTKEGKFVDVITDNDTQAESMLALGDGSLLVADGNTGALIRLPAREPGKEPATGAVTKTYIQPLNGTSQIAYGGPGEVLVAQSDLGIEAAKRVNLATEAVGDVYPNLMETTNQYGIAKLGNGRWIMSGGATGVISVDPVTKSPAGAFTNLFTDLNFDDGGRTTQQIGRACLSADFIAQHSVTAPTEDRCIDVPAGTALFSEDFETGDFTTGANGPTYHGLTQSTSVTGITASLENVTGGSRALKIQGGITRRIQSGLVATFTRGQPTYIAYRFKVGVEADLARGGEVSRGSVAVISAADRGSDGYNVLLGSYTYNDYLNLLNSALPGVDAGQIQGKWTKVEMRNINWQRRTFDFYVDCKRVGQHVDMPAGFGDGVDMLELFNLVPSTSLNANPNTVAWIDDIVIK